MIRPGVEFKTVKSDALSADGNFGKGGAYLSVEAIAVYAEVTWRITKTKQARQHFVIALEIHAGKLAKRKPGLLLVNTCFYG